MEKETIKAEDIAFAESFLAEFTSMGPFREVREMNKKNEGLGMILGYLYKNRGETVYSGDLAKVSGVSTARIAAALKKLELSGLVRRSISEKDSRKTVVSLTDAGLKMAEAGKDGAILFTAKVIEKVGREEMESFLRILCDIKTAVAEIKKEGCNV